ncbi:MAG TPA: succinate dehydrogenase cytochrome b subunit [Anaeromyxobacteraceae bacterium]|nr:succinate dehydrogenase cytochrome b subunit [Anaeromyxobacteraceae bacterium]
MSVATTSVETQAKPSRLGLFWTNQIGKKFFSAVTGIILFVFVLGHLLGNLQVFQGAEKLNAYAKFLQDAKGLLWLTRGVMLVAVTVHAVAGIQLWLQKRSARPVGYATAGNIQASVGSRTMIWTGLLTLAFVIFHLLDLTVGAVVASPTFEHLKAYQNVVATFRSGAKVAFYGVSLVSLGLHLSHGLYSMFQSLGLRHPLWTPTIQKAAVVIAFFLALAYILIPAAVVVGRIY